MTQFECGKTLIQELLSNNFEAYFVGGCVRDELLNLTPHDYDIATNAKPSEVLSVFQDYSNRLSGLKHGTVTIIYNNFPFEITTYRTESEYSDNRHPDKVTFVNSINDDLARRDFTINAMAMDSNKKIVDPFGGKEDLDKKLIRCVGNPNERFREDPLRMMRAVRFSAKLNFDIEAETLAAIKNNASMISAISKERIRDELLSIILYDPEKINVLKDTGLLKEILPEIDCLDLEKQHNKWHYTDVYHHTMDALVHTKNYNISDNDRLIVRLALLFHDTGKPKAKTTDSEGYEHFAHHPEYSKQISIEAMTRLRFSNELIKTISKLVEYHDDYVSPTNEYLRKVVLEYKFSYKEFTLLGFVKEADISAHVQRQNDDRMSKYFITKKKFKRKLKFNDPMTCADLKITGTDIIQELSVSGHNIQIVKNNLLYFCFNNPRCNEKQKLLSIIRNNKEVVVCDGGYEKIVV